MRPRTLPRTHALKSQSTSLTAHTSTEISTEISHAHLHHPTHGIMEPQTTSRVTSTMREYVARLRPLGSLVVRLHHAPERAKRIHTVAGVGARTDRSHPLLASWRNAVGAAYAAQSARQSHLVTALESGAPRPSEAGRPPLDAAAASVASTAAAAAAACTVAEPDEGQARPQTTVSAWLRCVRGVTHAPPRLGACARAGARNAGAGNA